MDKDMDAFRLAICPLGDAVVSGENKPWKITANLTCLQYSLCSRLAVWCAETRLAQGGKLHTSASEAMAMLDSWKEGRIPLQTYIFRGGVKKEGLATIVNRQGQSVELSFATEDVQVDLEDADFNGDEHPPESSKYNAYLVCEFRNNDRCAFYVLRAPRPSL